MSEQKPEGVRLPQPILERVDMPAVVLRPPAPVNNSTPDGPFQRLSKKILGRKYTTTSMEYISICQAMHFLFSDASQMQLPNSEISKYSGLFLFLNHAFINHKKMAKSIQVTEKRLEELISIELYPVKDIPASFANQMQLILEDDYPNWLLYEIPKTEASSQLLHVLKVLKAKPISHFEQHKDLNANLVMENTSEISIDPTLDFPPNYASDIGLFYASLIPEEYKSTAEKSWILL